MRVRVELAGLSDFRAWVDNDSTISFRQGVSANVLDQARETGVPFMTGYCQSCQSDSRFRLQRRSQSETTLDLVEQPNWRETLSCEVCGINNRSRAAFGLVRLLVPDPQAPIWLAEQTTVLYRAMKASYPELIGSEFIDPDLASGAIGAGGLRHEDITRSSFATHSLQAALSFDVLEHVPDYRAAFVEAHRVLRPGGWLVWTAPFVPQWQETQIRARVTENGIERLHPPVYHGDPIRPDEGVLCFQHFGWDALDAMRECGFESVRAVMLWSDELANIGEPLSVIVGRAG